MSFLEMNFDDVVEPRAVSEGEYKLRIIDVREGVDKNGNPYLMPRFEILGEVGASDFSHYIQLPNHNMDPKRLNNAKYRLKMFMDAFGLPYNGDTSEWIGMEGWAILGVEQNEHYGEQNYVKRWGKPADKLPF